MQMSPEELDRLGAFAINLVNVGVQAGISAAKENPDAPASAIHAATMNALQPFIAQKYTVAVIQAQIGGTLDIG